MLSNPYQQYQTNSVMTASSGELTLMLYNGAIKFINQGIEYIEKKEYKEAHIVIIKAQNIIEELRVTLDHRYQISQEIAALYEFVNYSLVEGNIKKDIKYLYDAKEIVVEFKNVWQELMNLKR